MSKVNYRLFPVYFLSFFQITADFSISFALILYYVQTHLNPELIGLISSSSSLAYLFSPVLFRNLNKKIGYRNCIIIAIVGLWIINFILQISLYPFLVMCLLFSNGILLGMFWPNIAGTISMVSKYETVISDNSLKDKLYTNLSWAWNSGGIFGLLLGSILLFIMSDIILMLRVAFISSCVEFVVVFFYEEVKVDNTISTPPIQLKDKAQILRENLKVPLYIPLFLSFVFGFLGTGVGLLYPLKSDLLNFALYTNYLLNLIKMIAQTIIISKSMAFNVRLFKNVVLYSFILLDIYFFLMIINENLIIFGILFAIFGIFSSFLYSFPFKLIMFRNVQYNTSKFSSYFETIKSVGGIISPLICGIIASFNINLGFIFLLFISAISFIVYIVVKWKITDH